MYVPDAGPGGDDDDDDDAMAVAAMDDIDVYADRVGGAASSLQDLD